MNKTTLPLTAALLTALLATTTSHADDLRCASELVQPGDSVESLLEKCGEPDSKVEENLWVYRKDGGTYQLSVSQGTVSEIKNLLD